MSYIYIYIYIYAFSGRKSYMHTHIHTHIHGIYMLFQEGSHTSLIKKNGAYAALVSRQIHIHEQEEPSEVFIE
jgi:hypothetical protein